MWKSVTWFCIGNLCLSVKLTITPWILPSLIWARIHNHLIMSSFIHVLRILLNKMFSFLICSDTGFLNHPEMDYGCCVENSVSVTKMLNIFLAVSTVVLLYFAYSFIACGNDSIVWPIYENIPSYCCFICRVISTTALSQTVVHSWQQNGDMKNTWRDIMMYTNSYQCPYCNKGISS